MTSVLNKNLVEDLQYEEEMNEKMAGDIQAFEKEREELTIRLREGNENLKALQVRIAELYKVEKDVLENQEKLNTLNREFDRLDHIERTSDEEKRSLGRQIFELTTERDNLVHRMSEMTSQYEIYVATTSKEREQQAIEFSEHSRLSGAKLLFNLLASKHLSNQTSGFSSLNMNSEEDNKKERGLKRLQIALDRLEGRRLRLALHTWISNALNPEGQSKELESLAIERAEKKRASDFFYAWRQAYLKSLVKFDNKLESIKRIFIKGQHQDRLGAASAFAAWRDTLAQDQKKRYYLNRVINRGDDRGKKQAFIKWLFMLKRENETVEKNGLNQIISGQLMSQKVFYAWREVIQKQISIRAVAKNQEWQEACRVVKKEKVYQRNKILVGQANYGRDKHLLWRCFNAMKLNKHNERFTRAAETLAVERPMREDFEAKINHLKRLSIFKRQKQTLRRAFSRYMDATHSSFQIWKQYVEYYNNVAARTKNQLTLVHRDNLRRAFGVWKRTRNKALIRETKVQVADMVEENAKMDTQIGHLRGTMNMMVEQGEERKMAKLNRVTNMMLRRYEMLAILKWKEQTHYLREKEEGLNLIHV